MKNLILSLAAVALLVLVACQPVAEVEDIEALLGECMIARSEDAIDDVVDVGVVAAG